MGDLKNRYHHERSCMAKSKSDLLAEAAELKLNLTEKNTVAEIQSAIKEAKTEVETKDTVASSDTASDEIDTAEKEDTHFTKSGKRSEKAVREAEAEAKKEARKVAGDTTPQDGATANIEKGPAPKTRPLAERKSKKYRDLATKIERGKLYSIDEAAALAVATTTTKFDSTVELHVRLGVDPKQADQNIRATVTLPNGTGKKIRVAALVSDDVIDDAKKAGADIAGEAEIVKLLEKENIDFDVLVATPQFMPKLGRFARLLGPRGLMPNPKAGTVSTNPVQAIKEAKGGKVEYRVDKQGIIHLGIGKVSFGAKKLVENANVFISSLKSVRPTTLKGNYILSATITTTMGPGVKVSLD